MTYKDIKYYFLSSLFIICVTFSVIELATRTISWINGKGFSLALHELDPYDEKIESVYEWHPFIGIVYKSNNIFEGSHPRTTKHALIFVDKHGFLSKDNSLGYSKAENEIRIATVGASTTASTSLIFEDNWPGRLGTLVQQALPDKKIRIINAGIPGFDTAQSIGNLALRVMSFKPDIVIIYHAYNDLKAIQHNNISFKPDYSHIHTTPYGYHKKPNFLIRWLNQSMFYVRIRNSYREYAQEARKVEEIKLGVKRLNEIPNDAHTIFEQHIRSLIYLAKAGNAQVLLASFATLHDTNRDYTQRETFEQS